MDTLERVSLKIYVRVIAIAPELRNALLQSKRLENIPNVEL